MTTLSTQYLTLVRKMREAQKQYFRFKDNLPECQRLEKEVDEFPWVTAPDDESVRQLTLLVRQMRDLQKQFFATEYGDPKRKQLIAKAKQAEAAVNKFRFQAPQNPTLFN